jgi:hypothetical protein
MRLYTFGNYYLSSIQQGIQAGHAAVELFNKYENSEQLNTVKDWAKNHKTMVCLNGGNNANLKEIRDLFKNETNPYPWTSFYEDDDSLNGTLTCVAIVLPEIIYDIASKIRSREYRLLCLSVVLFEGSTAIATLTQFELDLIQKLNSCGLAK